MGTVKIDNKENPTEITIESETGLWTFNADGMQYKVKKG